MKRLSFSEVIEASFPSELCISLYVPSFRSLSSSKEQDVQLRAALGQVQSLLSRSAFEDKKLLLAEMRTDIDEIRRLQGDHGVAWFVSEKISGYLPTEWSDSPLAVVSDTFHVKPIFRDIQQNRPFHVLALSGRAVKLFSRSRDGLRLVESHRLNAIEPSGPIQTDKQRNKLNTNRTEVANQILMKHLNHSEDPLVLAGSNPVTAEIRSNLLYPYVIDDGISCNADLMEIHEIYKKALKIARTQFNKIEDSVLETYRYCQRSKKSLTELPEITEAAVQGRVENLIISQDHHVWGRLNRETGSIQQHAVQKDDQDEDILDDLSEVVYHHKGSVWVLPKQKMENGSVFATLRW